MSSTIDVSETSLSPRHEAAFVGYALDAAGSLVHVSEVSRGKACECRCVACHRPLLAKKGGVRVHHFAHAHEAGCDGGLETVLHRLAKELLMDAHDFVVPAYQWSKQHDVGDGVVAMQRQLFPGGRICIDAVEVETLRFEGVKPDALIEWTSRTNSKKQLLVEIAVRHRVDSHKLSKLQQLRLPTLEIRMTPEQACQTRDQIRRAVLHSEAGKQWLYHPIELRAEREFELKIAHAEEAWRRECARRVAERRAHMKRMAAALSSSRTQGKTSMAQFFEHERQLEVFQATHGRLPTLEESRQMFCSRRS